jgi:Cys-rich four helix bundle protein (predicted Tat secretion target)
MNRRDAFATGSAVLLAAVTTTTLAQEHDHSGMHHGGTKKALIAAAADCVVKGQACLAHCLVLLADGDKSMGGCAKMVNQMLAVCGALQNLASQQSPLVPALAKVALDACQQCEQECRKHEGKHAECKACMESCQNCAKQCKAFAA